METKTQAAAVQAGNNTTVDGLLVEEARGILWRCHDELMLALVQKVVWNREAFEGCEEGLAAAGLLEKYVGQLNLVSNAIGHLPQPPAPPQFAKRFKPLCGKCGAQVERADASCAACGQQFRS